MNAMHNLFHCRVFGNLNFRDNEFYFGKIFHIICYNKRVVSQEKSSERKKINRIFSSYLHFIIFGWQIIKYLTLFFIIVCIRLKFSN